MVILLSTVLYLVSTAVGNNVTFGDYIGWYEGLDNLELELISSPPVFLKSAEEGEEKTSDRHHQAAQQFDKTMGIRRFSHLKLMISYMLGSGALACKFQIARRIVLSI